MRALLLVTAMSGVLTVFSADCAAAAAQQVETLAAATDVAEGRDPFQPLMPQADERRDLPPLQRVTLGELRLVATVRGSRAARALIEDGSGLGFITVVGNLVGIGHHRIVVIADGYIELEPPSSAAGAPASRVVAKLGQRLAGE